MPHTTSTTCGTCHVIGGWVPGTTTFNMAGVTTHMNSTLNIRTDLATGSCGACHGLPPPPNPDPLPTVTNPAGYTVTGTHPSGRPYLTADASSCGTCHVVGSAPTGGTISMAGVATHRNGILNFNP